MTLAVVLLLVSGYVSSYPIALKSQSIRASMNPGGRPDPWMAAYAPVEWLIDETPARNAIYWWADVCGCIDLVGRAANTRQLIKLEESADELHRVHHGRR